MKKIKNEITFNPKDTTLEEILGPAMKIDNKKNAEKYFKDYVSWMVSKYNMSQEFAEEWATTCIKRHAIRYYDAETIDRIFNIFQKCFKYNKITDIINK